MIHWAWLVLAVVVGVNLGLLIMGLCEMAGKDDERMPTQPDDPSEN